MYGNDAPSGTFPFFVSNGLIGGVIIHSHYILTISGYESSRFGYGLTEQQSLADILDPSYPYITNVVESIALGDEEMVIARVDPPFEFSPTVQPLKISDCSGPSNPVIGTTIGIFGLGVMESVAYAETMQVTCVETIEFTETCAIYDKFNDQSVCVPLSACYSDEGGPIVVENNKFY